MPSPLLHSLSRHPEPLFTPYWQPLNLASAHYTHPPCPLARFSRGFCISVARIPHLMTTTRLLLPAPSDDTIASVDAIPSQILFHRPGRRSAPGTLQPSWPRSRDDARASRLLQPGPDIPSTDQAGAAPHSLARILWPTGLWHEACIPQGTL